jgi:enoyl-CoA hydratase/carnithine racemase
VGLGIAKELLMTGRTVGSDECFRIGAANRIAPAAELEDVTQGLVDELLAASPLAVGFAKRVADGVAKPTLAASLEQEVTFQQILVATDDFREAGAAYMEKRPPNFNGAPPGATKRVPEPETA